MSTTDNGHAGAPEAPARAVRNTVTVAGRELTIERPSSRKASRAFAVIRAVGTDVRKLVNRWGELRSEYEASHYVEVDRGQAELRYGPRPLVEDGEVVRHPETITVAGEERPHPRAGELVMVPGDLEHLTEDAWAAMGGKVRLAKSPSNYELGVAIAPEVLDALEEQVYTLLALFTMSNAEVKEWRRDGTLKAKLDERVDELLDDANFDELLELAVVCGEVLDDQVVRKARELMQAGRLGNALRLFGLNNPSKPEEATTKPAESTETPPSSRPSSSTDSADSSDGDPTPPSTPPTSSPSSSSSSTPERQPA